MSIARFTVTDQQLSMEEAADLSRSFVDFWWALHRRRGAPPTRRDIDAYDLRPWIGRLHLWEATDDGDFTCRLWGTLIASCADRTKDGKRLSDGRLRTYEEATRRHYQAALERGEPTIHRILLGFDGRSCEYERTALPLASGANVSPMVLNLSLYDSKRMRELFDHVANSHLLTA